MNEAVEKSAVASRVCDVGWILHGGEPGFGWDPPRKFVREDNVSTHAKSVAICPAVIDHEARLFEILCPLDAQIAYRAESGISNSAGTANLGQTISLAAKGDWRHPERPLIQITTPYHFLADERVFLTQFPAFSHHRVPPLPGIVMGARMPIDGWPHPLTLTFEWHDVKRELVLRRGEPIAYVRFETIDPSRPVRLVEADMTPDLQAHFDARGGASSTRPKQLLAAKKRP